MRDESGGTFFAKSVKLKERAGAVAVAEAGEVAEVVEVEVQDVAEYDGPFRCVGDQL
jgi:hypothetical protein